MSFLATVWADAQKPRTTKGKPSSSQLHLLRCLASHYRDNERCTWGSTAYFSEKTCQSVATVERNLAALEAGGYIRRKVMRWGVNGGARRIICLNFEPHQVEEGLRLRRARSARGSGLEQPASQPIRSPRDEGIAFEPDSTDGSPHPVGGNPSECGKSPLILRQPKTLRNSQSKSTPPIPPDGGGMPSSEDQGVAGGDEPANRRSGCSRKRGSGLSRGSQITVPAAVPPTTLAQFERLWAAYPESGRLPANRDQAVTLFAALPAPEQEATIRAAAVEARVRAQHRSQARALHRWLERGLWRNGELLSGSGSPSTAAQSASPRQSIDGPMAILLSRKEFSDAQRNAFCASVDRSPIIDHAADGYTPPDLREPT
ncbi:hypothetical protein SAMN04488144_1595 [Methylobacterium sp. 190mf]|nr:hypothetical protein SAMN04488144_1595 [Methylobacterium sp. 190mf]